MAYAAPRQEESDQVSGPETLGVIQFLPGWAPMDDGSWRLSRYARLRVRKGRTSKLRRYPEGDGIHHNDVMDDPYGSLPVRAKCPTCGFMNAIVPDRVLASLIGLIPASPDAGDVHA
jgi:hypothetical protein